MSAYLQTLLPVVAVQIVLGYLLIRSRLAFLAWFALLFLLMLTVGLFFKATPILKMLALIAVTLIAMKTIVAAISYKRTTFKLRFIPWIAFSTGWVGMRAQSFESLGGSALPGARKLQLTGLTRVLLGAAFIAAAHLTVDLPFARPVVFFITTGLILTGLSFMLHFGLLTITAGLWRLFGANTYLLFRHPANSRSLAEFWGKRWNLAFIEMLSIAVLRPLKNSIGKEKAVLLSFILSGLLHELAITVPVNAGFGMPTAYFVIQGCAVLAEQAIKKRNAPLFQSLLFAKTWLLFWLVAPIGLLFPYQFIRLIIWPLAGLNLI